jgi:zinc transporter ZupT
LKNKQKEQNSKDSKSVKMRSGLESSYENLKFLNTNEKSSSVQQTSKNANKHLKRQESLAKPHNHSHLNEKSSLLMIMMGDALHNFSDGLAIGTSFASSTTAGFGTTIAVFFHELPHEIGDFAVLRKNHVPLTKAVLFNVLSSIFCFIGLFVGLIIGSIESFSDYSFLFIAGIFIYISLVDIVSLALQALI